jgi:hypothetical protein
MSTQTKTSQQWWQIITEKCLPAFLQKLQENCHHWQILRLESFVEHIFIRACRIRSIEEKESTGDVEAEYIDMINYCIVILIRLSLPPDADLSLSLSPDAARKTYLDTAEIVHEIHVNKNHDYGEAWRQMRITSFTDLILTKLLRVKQIQCNDGKTLVSEGIDANYHDIINYSLFALIRMEEQKLV